MTPARTLPPDPRTAPWPQRLHDFRAMGSPCRIRLAGSAAQHPRAAVALVAALAEIERIERRYSRYRNDSIVSRINQAAGSAQSVRLDAETAGLVRFAAALHQQSQGLFDITSGVLRRAWDFGGGQLPRQEQLDALLPLVGWGRVDWDDPCIRLPQAGMELDFGGFGKEYAADRAASLLIEAGLRSGYVNLGGDLRLLGPMPDGQPWQLGIADPRQPDAVASGVALADGALATSGDYERFIDHGGRRYCHILHPGSGWPVMHWRSVSVIAPACLAAGALTTLAMLHGAQAAPFLHSQGVPWLGIDADGQLHSHLGPATQGGAAAV